MLSTIASVLIDGTVIEVAEQDHSGLQNVVYNDHKRKNAVKFQAIVPPHGMFWHVYGPVDGRSHDWNLFCRSEIESQLEDVLIVGDVQYAPYGDIGYKEWPFLDVPFQQAAYTYEQTCFNTCMSGGRIVIEWMFKEVKTMWTAVAFPRKMCIPQVPVGTLYLAGMLTCNFRNCFYKNQTAIYFN